MKLTFLIIIFWGTGIFMSFSKFPFQKAYKTLNNDHITEKKAISLELNDKIPCLSTRFGGEVVVNLFTVHALEKDYPDELEKFQIYYDQAIKKLNAGTLNYDKEKTLFIKLVFLLQIRHSVGWTPFNQLNIKYKKMSQSEKDKYCQTDQTKLDYFYRQICEFSQLDFTTHFETWKLPISTDAKIYVAKLNLKSPNREVSRLKPILRNQ